jgi:hypothetical protein
MLMLVLFLMHDRVTEAPSRLESRKITLEIVVRQRDMIKTNRRVWHDQVVGFSVQNLLKGSCHSR